MRAGPLRQLAGGVGLVGLAPTAVLLVQGGLSPVEAAGRAVVTLLAVVLFARVAGWWLAAIAGSLERRADSEQTPPRRRHTDQPAAPAQEPAQGPVSR